MKALGIVVGSLLALSGAAAAVSPGEITFTAAKTYPKVDRLYGVRSDGTGLRVILRDVSHPAWSPDGRRFVFYGRHGFYVADAKAGHVRLVLGASCGFGSDDAWSPDGSRLALACNTTGTALHSRVVVVRPTAATPIASAWPPAPGIPSSQGSRGLPAVRVSRSTRHVCPGRTASRAPCSRSP